MSVRKKILKWRDLLQADIIVYQPAKVGSTFVVNLLKQQHPDKFIVHMHSFGLDRAYSLQKYEYLQGSNLAITAIIRTILVLWLRVQEKQVRVYVPMRDDTARRRSVFTEFFEEIIGTTRKAPWYAQYKYQTIDVFLAKALDWAVSKQGGNAWLEKECSVFFQGRTGLDIAWEHTPADVENQTFKMTVFNITDATQALGLDDQPPPISEPNLSYSKMRNQSSRKWCGNLGRSALSETPHDPRA